MPLDPSTLFVVALGSVFVVFLLFPFVYVLARLPSVWTSDRGVSLLLIGIVVATAVFFLAYLVGIIAITF